MKLRIVNTILILVVLAVIPGAVAAYDLPAVNLGFTSFVDGGPPAGPGFYFTQYLQYYSADQLNDDNGNALPFPDPDLDVWVSLSQGIYQSDQELFLGGKWGLDVIVPVVALDLSYNTPGPFPQDNGTGLGDVVVGPFIQWDPVMRNGRPLFMHRIELQMIFPTGKYDENKSLNPGSNFFSFNPYWAGTLFFTPAWTVSTRIHYLWNAENSDAFGSDDKSTAGQAVHLNFATSYEVIPKSLRLGINGYYLKQLTDSEVDGQDNENSKEQVFAIGPGALWSISQNNHLFFNAYFESDAENRSEGNRYTLRYVHHF
ncbi:MAG: phenol degradation protein meta [Desulfobulbaceae bacterium]|nr:phenol degradation protein meta [Desulfobulbaceae bacterium]